MQSGNAPEVQVVIPALDQVKSLISTTQGLNDMKKKRPKKKVAKKQLTEKEARARMKDTSAGGSDETRQ